MKYTVIQSLVLPAGIVVTLDADQADARRHALRSIKGNSYEVLSPVAFKRGESLDLDTPPKHLIALLAAEPRKTRSPRPAAEPSPVQQLDIDPVPAVEVGND